MQGAIEPQIFILQTVRPVQLQVMIKDFWNVKPYWLIVTSILEDCSV